MNDSFARLKQDSKSGLTMRRHRIGLLSYFDSGAIEKMLEALFSFLASPPEARMAQYNNSDVPEEVRQTLYEEECVYGEHLRELAGEVAIIALYKKVELDTKEGLGVVFPNSDSESFSKWPDLKKFLKKHGIDISTFNSYQTVNELRLVNNCIKHSGVVDKKLSIPYVAWKEGQTLSGLDRHFHRFAVASEAYISSLMKALLPKIS